MEFISEISISLLGGWILTALYLIANIGLPLLKKGTLKRLLTSPKKYHTIKQKIFQVISQISWFGTILLPVFYPIKINSDIFIFGSILFLIGMVLTVISILNYILTPLNEMVKKGLYKFSRNPIYAAYNILGFGIALLTGSWFIFILHIIEIVFNHFWVLDEEKYCISKYGKEYELYIKEVPRYYFWKV